QYARAFADHRAGRGGRARHRARRALADLDARVEAPRTRPALRLLLAACDPAATASGTPGALQLRPHVPVPVPRSGAQPPSTTAPLTQR
ncbi:hypothetical protein ACFWWS_33310, partial [Streptomyces sp. NPDC059083]